MRINPYSHCRLRGGFRGTERPWWTPGPASGGFGPRELRGRATYAARPVEAPAVPLAIGPNGLAYEFAGEGTEPLVLVHGSWSDRTSWNRLVPVLSSGFRMLQYDRRGHGESPAVPGLRSVSWEADELAELLLDADHFPAHILGTSYGAAVALSLTVRRPELVRSVIVHEPPLVAWPTIEERPEVRSARLELDSYARRFRTAVPEEAAREFAERFVTGPGGFDRLPEETRVAFRDGAPAWPDELSALERVDLDPSLLESVDLPALVTHGEVSPLYLRKITEAVADSIPNVTRQALRGAGHFPHVSHPALFGGAVLTFALERNVPPS
ncbi:MAG TPA: alpha/beta hydrolase [Thermoplasmata archaeon]|nr:alpha/beta hydrolase [Thermoplasmata archaeon]